MVVFVLAAGRAHETPEEHLGPDAHGIMVVDRYKAYQAIDQVKKGLIVLAFCCCVRARLCRVARTWPEQEGWALAWVEGIGKLYALNDARLAVRQQPAAFADADAALRGAVTALAAQGEAELADPQVHPGVRRVLESLGDHWTGLTVFVEHPEVPMDNNKADARATRAGGRTQELLWFGCCVGWTVGRHDVFAVSDVNSVEHQSTIVVDGVPGGVCHGRRKAPPDLASYLPWNLTEERPRVGP